MPPTTPSAEHTDQPSRIDKLAESPTFWGRLVGFAFICLILTTIKLMWGSKLMILDIPSFITVAGMTVGLTLLAFGPSRCKAAILVLVGDKQSADDATNAKCIFRMAAAFSLASGGVMTLVGMIIMLQNMSDPSQLGPSMAVALIAFLYGVIQAALCLAMSKVVSTQKD